MDSVLLGLIVVGFAAGLMDAAVGGGGLLQIPALFGLLPGNTPVPSVLGVTKFASCGGVGVCGVVFWGEIVGACAGAVYEACDVGGDAGDAGLHVLQEGFGSDGARCGFNAARVCRRLGNGRGDWFV